jgi:HNH endonuclease
MEHILARQHGGPTELNNLAWCCQRCNAQKGPNLTGIDPDTSLLVALFNPRQDKWDEHFSQNDLRINGVTPKGRATAWLLEMNSEERIRWRTALRRHGLI